MGIRNAIKGKWHWSYQKPWVTMSEDGQKSEIRVFWLHAIDKVVGRENDFAPKIFQNMHRVHNTSGNFKEMATISFRYSILLGSIWTRTLMDDTMRGKLRARDTVEILTSIISTKVVNLSPTMIFYYETKVFENLCDLKFFFKKI